MRYLVQLADGTAQAIYDNTDTCYFRVNIEGHLIFFDRRNGISKGEFPAGSWLSIMDMRAALKTLKPRTESGMEGSSI